MAFGKQFMEIAFPQFRSILKIFDLLLLVFTKKRQYNRTGGASAKMYAINTGF